MLSMIVSGAGELCPFQSYILGLCQLLPEVSAPSKIHGGSSGDRQGLHPLGIPDGDIIVDLACEERHVHSNPPLSMDKHFAGSSGKLKGLFF